MYQVSEAYREAMKHPVQNFRLRGKIMVGARAYNFTEKNIERRSFGISNQCSGSEIVEIGTVYTAQLDAILLNMNLPRYELENAKIVPELQLLTEKGYEQLPLGEFNIGEANWTSWGIEVTAYDNMSKFDKKLQLNASQGSAYDFLIMACDACGVSLGMSKAEIQALPNGSANLAVFEENDMETWRDLIAWIAQTLGCFATIDRAGALVLRKYGTTPVDTIDSSHRLNNSIFSDFKTRYTGLSVVNIAEKTTKYYSLDTDDGLTMNLGQNPFIQYGLEETLNTQRRAILDAIAVIDYVPFETQLLSSAMAYDLGDVVVFKDGAADEEKLYCITKFDWTYGEEYEVTGVGKNPALSSAKSKVDKNIAGLLSQTSQDVIHYYDFINAAGVHIEDGKQAEVINFRYVTTKNTHIDFHAEIKYNLKTSENMSDEDVWTENDGVIKITYYLNGSEVKEYKPVETMIDGDHLLHLLFTWQSSANIIGSFTVWIEMDGGTIDIERGNARAYIAGQGLAGDGEWDGGVNVSDTMQELNMSFAIGMFSDAVDITLISSNRQGISQIAEDLDMCFVLGDFTGAISSMNKLHRFDVAYSSDIMIYENTVPSGTIWKMEEGQHTGTVTTPDCIVDRIVRVTSKCSGTNVAFIVSFDSGETWWTYVDMWVAPDYTQDVYGMFESTMRSIPESKWEEKNKGTVMVRAVLLDEATLTDIQIFTEDIIG